MPVWKYGSIEEMPDVSVMNRDVPLGRRIRALLGMGNLAGPLDIPRGVTKFRSFEELQADRTRHEQERINRIRARNQRN
ncbi:MAG TPA: hypothetical protein VGQ76_26930 [Thermoanaerobaculia bacterium]|jgi:hypothetical protein|nr:hypothetical protein [Thermoanaerobaculia bacterium]